MPWTKNKHFIFSSVNPPTKPLKDAKPDTSSITEGTQFFDWLWLLNEIISRRKGLILFGSSFMVM